MAGLKETKSTLEKESHISNLSRRHSTNDVVHDKKSDKKELQTILRGNVNSKERVTGGAEISTASANFLSPDKFALGASNASFGKEEQLKRRVSFSAFLEEDIKDVKDEANCSTSKPDYEDMTTRDVHEDEEEPPLWRENSLEVSLGHSETHDKFEFIKRRPPTPPNASHLRRSTSVQK